MKNIKKSYLYAVVVLILVALAVTGTTSSTSHARAQVVAGSLVGWGWSDNIGWISFSCTNGGPIGDDICGSSFYGVSEDGSGNLTGYAWSDSVGWIQFGGLSSFPSGGGTQANAKVSSSGDLSGWAQAVVAAGRTDGWDGWISLSGLASDSSSYGIHSNSLSGASTGYAWGSNVMGWTTFSDVTATTSTSIASVALSVNPTSIATSTSATALLSWVNTNIDTTKTCAVSGSATATVPAGQTTYLIPAGSFTTVGTKNYTVTCTASVDAGGASTPSNPVSITVTANSYDPGTQPGTCPNILNATYCGGAGSQSTIINSNLCPVPPAVPAKCDFYCNSGFRQLGNTCVLNSTVQEN